MKSDTTFKRAFNDAIDLVGAVPLGAPLPGENELSRLLGVSRTTVRKVLAALTPFGLVQGQGRSRTRGHPSRLVERFPLDETIALADIVESRFMHWMLRDNVRPGSAINETELARNFGVATHVLREFLNRFQRFGLIERRPGAGWVFKGFTPAFAQELFDLREMFERRAALAFAALPATAPVWTQLTDLRAKHEALLADIDHRFAEFSALDSRFHRLLNAVLANRFIDSFHDIITMIFHYHYQWDKLDERQRNEVAAREHLAYIDALLSRDQRRIEAACTNHLASAKKTLMRATRRLN